MRGERSVPGVVTKHPTPCRTDVGTDIGTATTAVFPSLPYSSSSRQIGKSRDIPVDILGTVEFQISKHELLHAADSVEATVTDDSSYSFVTHSTNGAAAPLKFHSTLCDENVSHSRRTSALYFHPKYEPILLSGHGRRHDGRSASEGTIGVWAVDAEDIPLQRALISTAPITNLQMFSISPTLVLGGTSIGGIHLWDLRVKTALPISAFDRHAIDISDCHARQPITSMRTCVTSSPYFISTSASGYVCKWSLSQPSGPVSQSIANDPVVSHKVCINCMDFPSSTRLSGSPSSTSASASILGDEVFNSVAVTNHRSPSMFIGTAHGAVCRLEVDSDVKKAWTVASERGVHNAAVTSVKAHPGGLLVPHLDDVFASSSNDWTLKVWHFRRGHECKQVWSYDNCSNGPIHDVAWSSLHPSVVCCGDEAGLLSFHDVSGHLRNEATGLPIWKFAPKSTAEGTDKGTAAIKRKQPALTTLQWSNNDRFICTGDKTGNVVLWSTTSHMAILPDAEWMATFLKSQADRV